ncbi:MAG: imidazole glycerol phosphate synthase subunit HisH [Limnochordaceae bacterium]|nr:imidazole glycerol phosphate synthase subunit HisH [Limnochordaceae bacterium]
MKSMQRIAIVDYGMGNLRSVQKALERALSPQDARRVPGSKDGWSVADGREAGLAAPAGVVGEGQFAVEVTDDPVQVAQADAVVLPGVGAFGAAMANLRTAGLDEVVRQAIAEDRPFLGICLGLQLLFDESEERFGEEHGPRGLGVLPGRVRRFPAGRKVPQIGWNSLELVPSPLWAGLEGEPYAYFVHSYYVDPLDQGLVSAWAEYGVRFAAAVRRGNLFAVQFHPEKSSQVGQTILRNFGAVVKQAARAPQFFVPAIDLRHGHCVRLVQGDPGRQTEYADDPVAVARRLAQAGAGRLHVVDLDGALAGSPQQLSLVAEITRACPGVAVELGGGLRTLEQMEAALAAGVHQVILGTVALEQPELLAQAVRRFPGRVVVGLDGREGLVAIRGWQEPSRQRMADALRHVLTTGVRRVIVTDIRTDGSLTGPNWSLLQELAAVAAEAIGAQESHEGQGPASRVELVASGGVRDAADVEALARSPLELAGVVVGKALYEGRLSAEQGLAAARRGLVARLPMSPARAELESGDSPADHCGVSG